MSSRIASATAGRITAGTSRPVSPSTTVSNNPPTADPTTARPQAAASIGTMPNGSYHGVHTTRSADRISAGAAHGRTLPNSWTRSATPSSSANASSRIASGSVASAAFLRTAGNQQLESGQARQAL